MKEGEKVEPKLEVVSNARREFIKRERVRRALQKTKPGETICLQYEQTEILLKWIKELEERKVKPWA